MKVVILAGGFGTRIAEHSKFLPNPMIKVGKYPILVHIIKHYLKFGFTKFYIAIGYKGKIIKDYFKKKKFNCEINLIETGRNTMTGGRLKKIKKYIGNEIFFLTYGDGISNVNLKSLLKFHIANKKLVTLTAVRPPARFGAIKIKNNIVSYFREKSRSDEGWINGGFFVINPKFFDFIKNDQTYLEREPLEFITKKRQLAAYKHEGFWQCVDTKRDLILLNKILKNKKGFF